MLQWQCKVLKNLQEEVSIASDLYCMHVGHSVSMYSDLVCHALIPTVGVQLISNFLKLYYKGANEACKFKKPIK